MTTTIPVSSKYSTTRQTKYPKHSSGKSGCSRSITYSSSSPASGTLSTISSMPHKGTSLAMQGLRWSHTHLHQSIHITHLPPHLPLHILHSLPHLHEGRRNYLYFLRSFFHHLYLLCSLVNRWFRRCQRVGDVRSKRIGKQRWSQFLFLLFSSVLYIYSNSDCRKYG